MTKQEILKTAKPLLLTTQEIRAVQGGRQTQVRRPIKPQPFHFDDCSQTKGIFDTGGNDWACRECGGDMLHHAPYNGGRGGVHSRYKVGDILYVRETFQKKTDKDGYDICCSKGCPAGDDYPCSLISCIFGDREFLYYADEWHEQPSHGNNVSLYENIKWQPSVRMPKEAARLFLRVTDVRAELLKRGYNPWVWVYTFEKIVPDVESVPFDEMPAENVQQMASVEDKETNASYRNGEIGQAAIDGFAAGLAADNPRISAVTEQIVKSIMAEAPDGVTLEGVPFHE